MAKMVINRRLSGAKNAAGVNQKPSEPLTQSSTVPQGRPSDARVEGPNGQRLRANVAQTAAVFPGIGLGAIMSRSTRIRDEMIVAAAQVQALWVKATLVSHEMSKTRLFLPPSWSRLAVSAPLEALLSSSLR